MPDPAADSADGPGICEEGETRRTGPSPHTRMCQRRLPKSSPQSCHLQAEGARPAPSSPMAKVTVLKEQLQHLLISWYPDLRPLKSHSLLPKHTTHLPVLCRPFPSPLRSRWVTSSMGCSLHPPDTLPTCSLRCSCVIRALASTPHLHHGGRRSQGFKVASPSRCLVHNG